MSEKFSENGRLAIDRRRALQLAGASALVGLSPLSRARAATVRPIKVGYVSPETGPLAPMGETDDFVLKGVRAAFKDGVANPGRPISDRDHRQGQPVQSEPRGGGGGRVDPAGQHRPHGGRRDAREQQSGLRPVRTERGALHLDHHALAALVFRPRRRSGQGLPVDLPLLLGHRRHHRGVHQHLETGADQQEGRPVPRQRRRRQRLGRSEDRPAARADQDGLHGLRPRPLPTACSRTSARQSPPTRRKGSRSSAACRSRPTS